MTIVSLTGLLLMLVGLWAMLTNKNIIRIIIGFSIIDTGVHMLIVSLGYLKGATAPIIDDSMRGGSDMVIADPVPSALVLTAIVIGLAVTALMLTFAVKMYKNKHSLDINDFTEKT